MSKLHNDFLMVRSLYSYMESFRIERQLKKFGADHAKLIPTHTRRSELHTLYRLAQGSPPNASILEIGSYLGASTCYLAAAISRHGGNVFCVDTWFNETMHEGLRDTFDEFLANTMPFRPLLKTIRKRSECLVENDLSTPVDFVFIDGDHSYKAVKTDFENVASWLSENGVIALHDSRYFPGVSRVVGEALASGQWVLAGCVDNLCWIRHAPRSWRRNINYM